MADWLHVHGWLIGCLLTDVHIHSYILVHTRTSYLKFFFINFYLASPPFLHSPPTLLSLVHAQYSLCIYTYSYLYISICQPINLTVCLYLFRSIYKYIYLSISLSVCMSIQYLLFWLPFYYYY